MRLKSIQQDVAKSCLIGSITFDEQGSSLVKTYIKGLSLEAPKEYLELSSASPWVDELAKVAYDLYLRRGSEHGHDIEDWLMAEQMLRKEKERPGTRG